MRPVPLASLTLLVLSTVTALAEGRPFDGRWGWTAEDCALQPGDSDLVPIEIGNDEMHYYESHCRLDAVEPVGGEATAAWRVTRTCMGEGETWSDEVLLALEYGADERRRQLIEIGLGDGSVTVRQACD